MSKKEDYPLLIDMFYEFLEQKKPENKIPSQEARKNLEQGLIEISQGWFHSSNGLLITDNGYFITAKHCLSDLFWLKIKTPNGKKYKIEKICIQGKREDREKTMLDVDIVLAKANIPGECKIKKYNFLENPFDLTPVSLMTRRKEQILTKEGLTRDNENISVIKHRKKPLIYCKEFPMVLPVKPGDSGGIIITSNAEILGIFIA